MNGLPKTAYVNFKCTCCPSACLGQLQLNTLSSPADLYRTVAAVGGSCRQLQAATSRQVAAVSIEALGASPGVALTRRAKGVSEDGESDVARRRASAGCHRSRRRGRNSHSGSATAHESDLVGIGLGNEAKVCTGITTEESAASYRTISRDRQLHRFGGRALRLDRPTVVVRRRGNRRADLT
jgi:hypothetical protein